MTWKILSKRDFLKYFHLSLKRYNLLCKYGMPVINIDGVPFYDVQEVIDWATSLNVPNLRDSLGCSEKKLSEILGVKTHVIRTWVGLGMPRHIGKGGTQVKYRYFPLEVLEWLKNYEYSGVNADA